MQKYFFTFGSNHIDKDGNSLGNVFVVISANSEGEARDKMFVARGPKWAFSYPEKLFEGQAEEYSLYEKTLGDVRIPVSMQERPFGE